MFYHGTNLLKPDKFDKSEITRTTIKSFLRPVPQYLLAVKNRTTVFCAISATLSNFPPFFRGKQVGDKQDKPIGAEKLTRTE